MQAASLQTKPAPQQALTSQKKAYHSPNLRAAGSVRNDTEASPTGNFPDGMTTTVTMFTFYSPLP